MGHRQVRVLPGFRTPGANVPVQRGEDHGDAVRSSDFELQRPENDWACEREYWTHFRWIFAPLWWPTEAWVEEGLRAQETEETASRSAVAVLSKRLRKI